MNASGTRSFRALLLAVFVSSVPATLILPMMPSLGTAFGIGAVELGLLVGVYPLTSMIAAPFWGRMSDRFGRKPVLIATLFGGAFAFIVFAVSTSWLGLFVGRAMQGLAGTPRGVAFAVASDISEGNELASRMGSVTAAMAMGFALGPIAGGLFMGEDPSSWLGQLRSWLGLPGAGFNHVLPSMLGVAVNLLAVVSIVSGFRESWHPGEPSTKQAGTDEVARHSFREAILQASVIVAILFFLLSGFIQGSLQFSFALWADITRGWTAQYIAWAGAFIGLGFAVGSGALLKPVTRRLGLEKTVLAGTIIDALGLTLFLVFQASTPVALAGLFVSSLGGAFWGTTILTLLSRQIDERDQGLALGVANGATLFGRVLGPALAGWLAANVAAGGPFALILFCVSLAILRAVLLVRHHRRPQNS